MRMKTPFIKGAITKEKAHSDLVCCMCDMACMSYMGSMGGWWCGGRGGLVGSGVGVGHNWVSTMKLPVQWVILCHVKMQSESKGN